MHFDASFNAIPQLLLFRVQDFTGSLYIWKISKFIFLDRKICMRIYFNKSMPPSSKQLDVQIFYYLISSHCFQCASVIQINIKRWEQSNCLWICSMLYFLINQFLEFDSTLHIIIVFKYYFTCTFPTNTISFLSN